MMKMNRVGLIAILPVLYFSLPTQAFTLACSNCSSLLGWQTDELAFELNAADCPEDIRTDIKEAFEEWNKVSTSKLELKLGEDTSDDVATVIDRVQDNPVAHAPVIICDPDFQTTFSLSSAEVNSILGVANFNTVSGLDIKTGYLILNAQDGSGGDIFQRTNVERQIVIAHEVGHVIGLGHSEEASALMHFSIGEKTQSNLHQDDVDGISYLYPRSEPGDGVFGCGLVTSQGGGSPPPPSPFFFLTLLFAPLLTWRFLTLSQAFSINKL